MRGAWKKCQNIEGDWGERALDALRLASSSVAEENTSAISGKNSTCGGKVSKMNLIYKNVNKYSRNQLF